MTAAPAQVIQSVLKVTAVLRGGIPESGHRKAVASS